jgi:hypothetical protein
MGQMRQLTDARLRLHEGGDRIATVLSQLRLGCFEDARGYYWLGVVDPNFPEHSRWLHVLDRKEVTFNRSWYAPQQYDVYHGAPAAHADRDDISANLLWNLDELHGVMDRVIRRAMQESNPDTEGETYARLLRNGLQTWQTFGSYDSLTPKTLQLAWGDDMHELICHYETWQVHHPEAAGLPHEIALRMHGLTRYARQVAGIEPMTPWLAKQRCVLG